MPTTYTTAILITGGTSGLGWHTALNLAHTSPPTTLLILASRSAPAAPLPSPHTKYLALDLSSAAGVQAFVKTWSTCSYPSISALILNAGLQFLGPPSFSPDGYENTFAINHLGNAHLYYRLLAGGFLAPTARIILVGSQTHSPAAKTGLPDAYYATAEALAHPGPEKKEVAQTGNGRQRYGTSKLCNLLWAYALKRRLGKAPEGQRKSVLVFNPGLMPGTGLARAAPAWQVWIWKRVLPRLVPLLRVVVSKDVHTQEESGRNLAGLVGKVVGEGEGLYFENNGVGLETSKDSLVEAKQEDLWTWTVKAVAKDEGEREVFERGW
ncbi:NAD(P)-binding protein [Mytilinidion resinicola]|uniref:NAD(P)-binding protein n=1 Tax=Mytilinidion resinicola TaxID=574789 RepID=A0A6A6YAK3_9PEZI|nr:NAD(P)-binding protein [Mytilinidion resinicola]KAF2805851.1 NAD(P)-binding protein [Mytilinidion resinicola]